MAVWRCLRYLLGGQHNVRSASTLSHASVYVPKEAVMCKATNFEIIYKINPWMIPDIPVDRNLTISQWTKLKAALTDAGVTVHEIEPSLSCPDQVFACDQGLLIGNKRIYLAHFNHPARRKETHAYRQWLEANNYEILGGLYNFEGGDALFLDDKLLFGGYGIRSQIEAYKDMERGAKFRVVPCRLVDERFFHIDTCLCPLDGKSALWYPPAVDQDSQHRIRDTGIELYEVPDEEAKRFACNAVVLGQTIITREGNTKTKALLERKGFNVVELQLGEFLKAGGSAHCLVLLL